MDNTDDTVDGSRLSARRGELVPDLGRAAELCAYGAPPKCCFGTMLLCLVKVQFGVLE